MSNSLRTASEQAPADYDSLKNAAAVLDLGLWSLISLSGDDRKGWLQGQATNDVREFDRGSFKTFCLCTPTGQLQAVIDGWCVDEKFLLTCEKTVAQTVLERVERMVVLEDVAAEDLTSNFVHLSIQGPGATRELGQLLELPTLDAGVASIDGVQVYVLRSRRTALGGWDLWIPAKSKKAITQIKKAFAVASLETYQILRVEAGIPSFGWDYTEKTLAPELGRAFTDRYISFNKGCYTGQEVLMRIHSRGHTNRTWVGLYADAAIYPGATIQHRANPTAGTVTSSALSPEFGHIGMAFVRNEVALDEEVVTVHWDGDSVEAEIRHLPF
jgi:tRNA-modifying protein YgfZ